MSSSSDTPNTQISDSSAVGNPPSLQKFETAQITNLNRESTPLDERIFKISKLTVQYVQNNITAICLRLGLSFVFLYAAIEVLLNPSTFIKYTPEWLGMIIPIGIFLPIFATFEFVLAFWLISGQYSRLAGLISALLLFNIVLFNTESFPILFRNVAIMFAGFALATIKSNSDNS